MSNNFFNIIKPSTILKKNLDSDVIDSECLFGETFKLIKRKGKWVWGVSIVDNYDGWINSEDLGIYQKTNYIVCSQRSCLLTRPNVKSTLIKFLPLRSKINVIEIDNNWAKIRIPNSENFGYILVDHILSKNIVKSDWVYFCELLLGVPYRWGGRNSIGIDCSALLQLSKGFKGEFLPRDTIDQLNFFKKSPQYFILKKFEINALSRGDILHWPGHIAIVVNNISLIHSSARHGKVVIENINDVILRIKEEVCLIKEN